MCSHRWGSLQTSPGEAFAFGAVERLHRVLTESTGNYTCIDPPMIGDLNQSWLARYPMVAFIILMIWLLLTDYVAIMIIYLSMIMG